MRNEGVVAGGSSWLSHSQVFYSFPPGLVGPSPSPPRKNHPDPAGARPAPSTGSHPRAPACPRYRPWPRSPARSRLPASRLSGVIEPESEPLARCRGAVPTPWVAREVAVGSAGRGALSSPHGSAGDVGRAGVRPVEGASEPRRGWESLEPRAEPPSARRGGRTGGRRAPLFLREPRTVPAPPR